MKKITDLSLQDKKVLVRCDFNVGLKDGEIVEDIRIQKALETIEYAKSQGVRCIMVVSHLGRPEGEKKKELSLYPVKQRLEELLGSKVGLIDNPEDIQKNLEKAASGEIFLLENIRYWKEEKEGDRAFSSKIAGQFDVYINDAFSASHRAHASIAGFPEFTPEGAAGLLFEKELKNLSKVRFEPSTPAVAIIGGAKIETKLPVIKNLEENYDFILVGGMTANEALDEEMEFSDKVLLPEDFSPKEKKEDRLDVGPATVEKFIDKINSAQTVVWNGPLGMFEDSDCAMGTKKVMEAIEKNKKAFKLVGGGETLEAVNRFSSLDNFDYVSMSGGAMLEFLAGKKLPGIEVLK